MFPTGTHPCSHRYCLEQVIDKANYCPNCGKSQPALTFRDLFDVLILVAERAANAGTADRVTLDGQTISSLVGTALETLAFLGWVSVTKRQQRITQAAWTNRVPVGEVKSGLEQIRESLGPSNFSTSPVRRFETILEVATGADFSALYQEIFGESYSPKDIPNDAHSRVVWALGRIRELHAQFLIRMCRLDGGPKRSRRQIAEEIGLKTTEHLMKPAFSSLRRATVARVLRGEIPIPTE